jgi:type IV pilus assembly protein PilP
MSPNLKKEINGMNRFRIDRLIVCLMVLVFTIVAGCGDKKKRKAPPKKKEKVVQVAVEDALEAAKEKKAEFAYVYSPVGKRDPFRSKYKVLATSDKKRPGSILTRYEIQQLKLSAIISGTSRPMAQVELPDGKGVLLKIGTPVGKNNGKVVRIKHDEVIVAEEYRDARNRKMTNYVRMKIEQKKEK